jgi:hypothetical protein
MKIHPYFSIRAVGVTMAIILLIAVAAVATPAQSTPGVPSPQTPDVQQLKERVKQLEQTVEDLKVQISVIEDAQKQKGPAPDTVAVSQKSVASADPSVVTADPPKSKQDNKGESSLEIYGFVQLDAGYQFKQNHPDWFDVLRPTKLPAFRNEFGGNGHTFMGVRQSRFGVRSSTPTKWGELKTLFEFELFGTGVDAGQTTFRLRHAYGELGQVGAGQTWSVFMDPDVFPDSLEYWGPPGMVFFRNVQVRWMPIKGRSRVTIALERPGASADQGEFANRIELQGVRPQFAWPDLTWQARYGRSWGYIQAAGIVGSMKWVDTNDDQFDLGGSDVKWGINLSSNLNFTKKDVGRFQVVYGEGIQNYMNDAPVDVGIENTFGGDPRRPIKGKALPVLGVVAFLDHKWNDKFSSTAGFSMVNIENSSGQTADAYHRGYYALTNLLWRPFDRVTFGGELQWGQRNNWRDGFTSDDFRVQFGFKYNFGKVFKFD